MTEREWLAGADPLTMLFDVYRSWQHPHHGKHRKLRLFACACCRLRTDLMADIRWVAGVEAVERHAEGIRTRQQAQAIKDACDKAEATGTRMWANEGSSFDGAFHSLLLVVPREATTSIAEASKRHQILLMLRDILGNPFRPVTFDSSWLTSTVLTLATGIYFERAFDHLPILADALQDAGCDNDDILTHLRGDGPHVKGCWALDLVLGKA